jgi:hypothetical protein|eukprot:COSAG01_NODE_9173_length_2529_cov_8.300000_4_plen_114_part_00
MSCAGAAPPPANFPPSVCIQILCVSRCADEIATDSLRSPRGWRYTEWLAWDGVALTANWTSGIKGAELYDHRGDNGSDFGGWENVNLANQPEFAQEVVQLHTELRRAFLAPDV